jgi:hypothetical protein
VPSFISLVKKSLEIKANQSWSRELFSVKT